jgi:hypothetical protein
MAVQRVFGNPLVITLIAVAACYGVYKVAEEVIPAVTTKVQTELTAKQRPAREHKEHSEQKTGEKRP